MKTVFKSLAAGLVLGLSSFCFAEVAVIVHPSSAVTSLTEDDVARLFLGKAKSFPSGGQAVPVNQNEGSAAREKFNEAVCKKNASQYKPIGRNWYSPARAPHPKMQVTTQQ